jgi:hypothetical protein
MGKDALVLQREGNKYWKQMLKAPPDPELDPTDT